MTDRICAAFNGRQCIAAGTLSDVAVRAKAVVDQDETASILIFDDLTGETIEVDFRGSVDDLRARFPVTAAESAADAEPGSQAPRGPGRPKLGVVAREVTLLPRHWEWLQGQPGGASVTLRKLVEEARRTHAGRDRQRRSQEAAYRFMTVMAGNLPGFEEATRALFAGQRERFTQMLEAWPADIANHARKLAAAALAPPTSGA